MLHLRKRHHALLSTSDPAKNQENNNDKKNKSNFFARTIFPTSAIWPRGKAPIGAKSRITINIVPGIYTPHDPAYTQNN
jgi:hypothetical protein